MFRQFFYTPFYNADSGANGGGAAGSTGADGNATGQAGQTAGNANGGAGSDKKPTLAELLKQHGLQGEFDSAIQSRLEREKQKRDADAEKARKEQEAKTLEEQGNFKTLAEQRAQELADARSKLDAAANDKKALERYQGALKAQLDSARKDLPAHITALLDKLDPVDQLTWLAENRETLAGQSAQGQSQQRGRGTPGATGQQGRLQAGQGAQRLQQGQQAGQQGQDTQRPRRSTL